MSGRDPSKLVAHLATTFNHRSGGIDRLYKRLRAVRDSGYGVALVVGRDYHPSPGWDLSGIKVYRVPHLVKYIDPAKDFLALRDLVTLLRRIRPDAVHTHLAKAGILGRWAAYLSGTPLILHTVHGPTFPSTLPFHKRVPYLWLEWITGRVTDYFVFVGGEVREEYIKRKVCRSQNSVIVRTGRPDAEIDEAANTQDSERSSIRHSLLDGSHPFLIACVGRVVPSKQQDHAVRVLHRLRRMGVAAGLVIVGEGYVREEKGYLAGVKRIVEETGLQDHVCFTGHRDDALQVMAAADAILHTSKYEGLPNILVEAALVKRPVVTYTVSGAAEVIRDKETGFIVPQGDTEAAAERLAYLAANPETGRRMGARAHSAISAEYRESRMIRNKLQFYDRVLGPPAETQG